MIVAPTRMPRSPRGAFANLRRNLDPYLQVLGAGADFFVFQGFSESCSAGPRSATSAS